MPPSSETPKSKLERKQEAKKLKRQLILDNDGKRPRKKKTHLEDEGNVANKQEKQRGAQYHQNHSNNNKKKKNHGSSYSNVSNNNNRSTNRFGKVMVNTPCPKQARFSTLSIAIPGSIVSNAQTMELRTYLIGQIARACTIYHVDEIIVFDDNLSQDLKVRSGYSRSGPRNRNNNHYQHHHNSRGSNYNKNNNEEANNDNKNDDNSNNHGNDVEEQKPELKPSTNPHTFMANILQYCECPQYLRRHFFPMHPDLQFAGLLNPLDAPHHVRVLDKCMFREGVVLDKRGKADNGTSNVGGSLVDCGIRGKFVEVLTPGIRCTVQMDLKEYSAPGKKILKGKVVSPSAPRELDGTYWGYSVRMASSIKAIFDDAPYKGGYDLKIGTSERGNLSVDDQHFVKNLNDRVKLISLSKATATSSFQHAVIVFGGVAGIEECIDADETIGISGNNSSTLFDLWVNICEYQGSRTIRTEEAVLIGLSRLCPHLFPINNKEADDEEKEEMKLNTITPQTEKASKEIHFSDEEPSEEESSSDEE